MKSSINVPEPDEVKKSGAALKKTKAQNEKLPFVNATIGVLHSEKEKQMPEWYHEASRLAETDKLTGYNFFGIERYLKLTARLLFGGNAPTDDIAMAPSYGGTGGIFLGSEDLKAIVPMGIPTWPNHKGLIETAGGIFVPYQHLTKEGEFNCDEFIKTLDFDYIYETYYLQNQRQVIDVMSNRLGITPNYKEHQDFSEKWFKEKSISPMIEGDGKNPLSIGIDRKYWQTMADEIKKRSLILQVDLAYLGQGKSIEEDLQMVQFFKSEGVPMFIYFSYSKFHGYYDDERVGAVLGVNLKEDRTPKEQRLLHTIRNTTSAVASKGQTTAWVIENYDKIRKEQRLWLENIKKNSDTNREIIAPVLPKEYQYFKNGTGPFLFAPDYNDKQLSPYIFPEYAKKFGHHVPEEAKDFPSDKKRIAGILNNVHAKNGDLSGIRLNLSRMSQVTAIDIRNTLEYAYDKMS